MREYKGADHKKRVDSLKKTKLLIQNKIIPSPYELKCEMCGQDKGVREYHNTDYFLDGEEYVKSLQCLCFKCHRAIHAEYVGETSKHYGWAKNHLDLVRSGKMNKPTYTRYYTIEDELNGKYISK